MKTTKRTAANSKLLAKVKRICNTPIFKNASKILNETQSEEAVITYLSQYFTNAENFKA